MSIVLLLLVLALIAAALGIFVSALKWALIIAGVLLVAAVVAGWTRRDSAL